MSAQDTAAVAALRLSAERRPLWQRALSVPTVLTAVAPYVRNGSGALALLESLELGAPVRERLLTLGYFDALRCYVCITPSLLASRPHLPLVRAQLAHSSNDGDGDGDGDGGAGGGGGGGLINDGGVAAVAPFASLLRSLHCGSVRVAPATLLALPRLAELDLGYVDQTLIRNPCIAECTQLRALKCATTTSLTAAAVRRLPSLRCLDCGSKRMLRDTTAIAAGDFASLRVLFCGGVQLADIDAVLRACGPQLTALHFGNFDLPMPVTDAALHCCTSLCALDFGHRQYAELSVDAVCSLSRLEMLTCGTFPAWDLGKLRSLEVLRVGSAYITDDDLVALSPTLRELQFTSHVPMVSDAGIAACKSLLILHLGWQEGVGDGAIAGLTQLVSLHCGHLVNSHVTADTLHELQARGTLQSLAPPKPLADAFPAHSYRAVATMRNNEQYWREAAAS